MRTMYTVVILLICSTTYAQIAFTNQTSLLTNTSHFSGVHMGISDMNGDGLDDIIRYQQGTALNIEYQTLPNSGFTSYTFGNVASSSQWSTCIADYDHNGFNDLLVGGAYDNIKLLSANGAGSAYTMSTLANSNIFLQGSNFADINNDGFVDIYACHDDDESLKYKNLQNGSFLEEDMFESTLPSGNSGNYASIWTDYDNDGDIDMYLSKCRSGESDPTSPTRVNLLFQNDGNHVYNEVGAAAGLNIGDQTWSTDFADIDNDGDMDCYLINHFTTSILMENNGDGTFTDITAASGMVPDLNFFGIQAFFRDFDNDGFVDLVISGDQDRMFRNNGNKTFTRINSIFDANEIESMAIGDLNNDGYLDIYAGYANFFTSPSSTPDKLWMNNGGANNFFKLALKGTDSNINGIGARIEIRGLFGVQVREVRSGEGYGVHNSFTQHFGLGLVPAIQSVTIKWPSGIIDVIRNPAINQTLQVTEGTNSGCYVQYIINSDPIPARLFEASQNILSTGTVANGTTVDFEAGLKIELQPGFIANANANFTAQIKTCP